MLITNHKGSFIKAVRTSRGGLRIYKVSQEDATDFVTDIIFDVLEIMSKDEDKWIAVDKEEDYAERKD